MKKIILLATAIMMAGSLTGCFSLSAEDTLKYNPDPKARSEAAAIIESSKEEETTELSTAYGFFKRICDNSNMELPENAATFLKEHDVFFKNGINNLTNDFVDFNLSGNQVVKNPARYGDKLIYLDKLNVLRINESEKSDGSGYYTVLYGASGEPGYLGCVIIYDGTLDTIVQGDTIYAYALPLNIEPEMGSFTLAGSVVGKYGENPSLPNGNTTQPETQPQTEAPTEASVTTVVETEAQAQSVQNNSDLTGTWLLKMNDDDVNVIDISYDSSEGNYYARFNGSYGDASGYTEGPIYDNGDGTWRYYDSNDMAAGSDNPAFMISLENDSITVTSVMGDTYGDANFPGFAGTYESW